mgnify:CR=1 FL=1
MRTNIARATRNQDVFFSVHSFQRYDKNTVHLARGKADVYPRFAPTMEWDIAAGQAILEALGGGVFNAATGMSLRYNKEDLTNPYFIAQTAGFMQIML